MMAEQNEPPIPASITDGPQAEAMEPIDKTDKVTKITHEIDADDMFQPTT